MEWERMLENHISEMELKSKIYKELIQLNSKKKKKKKKMQHKKKEKETNNLNRHFSTDTEMANKYMKKCSISLSIRKIQMKSTIDITSHLLQCW